MYLDNLEHQFILNDMAVVNEFEVSSFLAGTSSAIKGKFTAVEMKSKLEHYSSALREAMSGLAAITVDTKEISNFLSKAQTFTRLSNSSYTVRDINSSYEDVVIKPQYISQCTDEILRLLNDTINGNANQSDIDKYAEPDNFEKIKRQIITGRPLTPKEVIKGNTDTYSIFGADYIKQQLIPFVSKASKIKETLNGEATAVLHAIKESEDSFNAALSVLGKIKMSGKLSADTLRKVDYVSYKLLKQYLDILGIATFTMIHKINIYCTNVLSAEKCYYDVLNFCGNGVCEGVMDDIFPTDDHNLAEDLEAGRSGAYASVAQNLYDYHSNNPLMGMVNGDLKSTGDVLHSVFGTEIDFTGYSKEVYDSIIKMYLEIGVGLGKVAASCDDYIMIFDDIRKSAGFVITLKDRFRGLLAKIDDLTHYSSDVPGITDNNTFANALAEVKDFAENMEKIASAACDVKTQMDFVDDLLENKVRGEFKDAESLNELKIMMDRLHDEFRELNTIVASRFMIRLRTLGEILATITTHVEDPNKTPDTVSELDLDHTDYRVEAFLYEIESMEQKYKHEFELMEEAYNADRIQRFRKQNPIFEAETPSPSNPSGNASGNENTSTKPSVVDNSNNSGTSGTESKTTGALESIVEKIRKFISVFLSNLNRNSAKNTKWVNEHAQALSNRDYTNVTLNILPYKNIPYTTIVPNINGVARTIRGMNPQTLQGIKTKQDAYSKVFASLKNSGVSAEGQVDPSVQIENYFKTGDVNGAKIIAISNNDLKSQVVSEMIPYCQNYAKGFSEGVQKALTDAGKAVEELSGKVGNAAPNNNTQNDNTAGNMQQSAKWVGEAVTDLSKGVLNAIRQRNNHYLEGLSSLKPKDPVATNQVTTNPEENQAEARANATVNTAQAQATEPVVSG